MATLFFGGPLPRNHRDAGLILLPQGIAQGTRLRLPRRRCLQTVERRTGRARHHDARREAAELRVEARLQALPLTVRARLAWRFKIWVRVRSAATSLTLRVGGPTNPKRERGPSETDRRPRFWTSPRERERIIRDFPSPRSKR